MTGLAFDKDWWYPPLRLSEDRTIVFSERDQGDQSTTTGITATIPAGVYWGTATILDPNSNQIPLKNSRSALLGEVTFQMALASPNTGYQYSATETEDSTGTDTSRRKTGLALSTTQAFDVRLDFGDGSFDFPPELLGYDRDRSTNTDYADPLVSPKSQFGRWTPLLRQEVGAAVEKPKSVSRSRSYSDGDDRERAYESRRGTTIEARTVTYEKVTALSIVRGRADLDGYPDYAQAADGDDNAALLEHLSRAAKGSWLVVHDSTDPAEILGSPNLPSTWERVHLQEGGLDSSEMVDMTDRSPEIYTVELPVQIAAGDYRQ